MTEYYVGQKVLIRDINRRRDGGPTESVITRVGRKLVYIEQYGREVAYRIEDGRKNDNYGHSWLQTPEQYVEEMHRDALWSRLNAAGLRLELGMSHKVSTDKLERVVAIMEETDEH